MNLLEHYSKIKQKAQRPDIELTDSIKKMVMKSCNVRGILQSWNVHPVLRNNQWNGYCPDHFLHDGHAQHLPKWSMNAETGDCTCFTSDKKGSNFIHVARRMYRLDTLEQTIKVLTNGQKLILPPPDFVLNQEQENIHIKDEQSRLKELKKGVDMVEGLLKNGHISDECLQYFANDGITKDTLDFLGVCSMEHGYLQGRAIIPFLNEEHRICGYIAVNYMGKEWWVKKTYDKMHKIDSQVKIEDVEKGYRKTLYCTGFASRNHLYGQYEVLNGGKNLDKLVLVEGERDAMKLLQEGIDCVSIHGTHLKDEQKVMIKKMNPHKLFLGFDMDDAGNKAVEGAYQALYNEVQDIYVLNFPENKDPKKFNGNELNNIINESIQYKIKER